MPVIPVRTHAWDLSPEAARALQVELAPGVIREDRPPADGAGEIATVAGIDIGFEEGGAVTRAAVAVVALEGLSLRDHAVARRPTSFPYIPGLLSFREIPAALDALAALRSTPDLLMCDGQGIAHPRRFGIASHLGYLCDMPAIGAAKSLLCGRHDEPEQRSGAWTPLRHRGEVIGAALRTRVNVRPIYVSIGHRVGLERAIELTLRATGRYRLPEPTRLAHRLASGPRR
ncbi:MAG TPA: deoxyribonuclease V [Geminicoccaceae bacterium]|nr:deoxyribonuclease V [Geminicoccaceae bacterium]